MNTGPIAYYFKYINNLFWFSITLFMSMELALNDKRTFNNQVPQMPTLLAT